MQQNGKLRCDVCYLCIGSDMMFTKEEHNKHSADKMAMHVSMAVRLIRTEGRAQRQRNDTTSASLAEIKHDMDERFDSIEAAVDLELKRPLAEPSERLGLLEAALAQLTHTVSEQRKMIISQAAKLETQGVQLDEATTKIEQLENATPGKHARLF